MRRPTSIMIVENNTDLRNTLRHVFEDRGYLTWTCPLPEIAISIFRAIQPSMIILDLDYEDCSAIQLLDDWLTQAPSTRIIVESVREDRIQEAKDHGAREYLTKPYTLEPLYELIDHDEAPDPISLGHVNHAA